MSAFADQIERIRYKLEVVSPLEQRAPVVTPAGVGALQERLGRDLPAAYQAFVTTLSDGGPGPNGTLLSLAEAVGRADSEQVLRACDFREGVNGAPEYQRDLTADPGNFAGVLRIDNGDRRCVTGLVVTGPSAGRVVYVDPTEPPYVVREANFLDWYERWLDEHLAGQRPNWFGRGPAGGEPELLGILREGENVELQLEAIGKLSTLPALSDDVWESMERLLTADHWRLRLRAMAMFTHAPKVWTPHLVRGLTDTDARVRAETAILLLTRDAGSYHEMVWHVFLDEPDEMGGAVAALARHGKLTARRRLRVLTEDKLAEHRNLALRGLEFPVEHRTLAARLLSDNDSRVRHTVATTMRRMNHNDVYEAGAAQLEVETDPEVLRQLMFSLGRAGWWDSAEAFLRYVESEDALIRSAAIFALAALGDDRLLPIVIELMSSGDQRSVRAARMWLESSPNDMLRVLARLH